MQPSSIEEDREFMARMSAQAEGVLRKVRDAQLRLQEITGAGEAADGLVRAVAGPTGHIIDLTVSARCMRLDRSTVAAAIRDALRAAQLDARRQAQQIIGDLETHAAGFQQPLDASFVAERAERVLEDLG
ncbi:YbaB/EbfC family DNA-binding protein [Nonomuraea deserti]|uniref:YbaB/EbfC family DNA-binding protein n=1 Tax=Nonomuraea deserti TaxID=1848322 RepID=A0A4R4UC30_9ACTN|nr:YbaB/EbfC family nucleoid-associated protein [Nonomuraea deserti]TDC87396.1 YbaB/EbfC family DNA-binding protein [Nonomuraea deserti]